jgi:hypothetical protein
MGIRETQLYGLTKKANLFILENAKRTLKKKCKTCGNVEGGEIIKKFYKNASSIGMFDDGPLLNEYTLKDGTTIKEIVQASPWSAGPCIFLCLEKKGKRMFEWNKKIIDNC